MFDTTMSYRLILRICFIIGLFYSNMLAISSHPVVHLNFDNSGAEYL